MEKKCKKCGELKDISYFETKTQVVRGYTSTFTRGTCRKCMNSIYDRSWKARNRGRYNEYQRVAQNNSCKRLGDSYIRHLIAYDIGISQSIVPQELVVLKRQQLKLTRNVRKIKAKIVSCER